MSLTLLFRDELVADQRCVLKLPHAFGQHFNAKKLHVAQDKTFAFAVAGPTLSEKEKSIFESIIAQSFKEAGGENNMIPMVHKEWMDARLDMSVVLMTKAWNYHIFMTHSESQKSAGYGPELRVLDKHHIVRLETDFPSGAGTGFQVASMAVLEGIAMKDVVPIVADVLFSVGPEFDIVHRKSLKRMVL